MLYYFSKWFNFQVIIKNYSSSNLIRLILISSLLISFIMHCLSFWIFIKCYYSSILNIVFSKTIFLDLFFFKISLNSLWNFKLSLEFFGFIFILLAYIVGLISFLALDSRLYWKNIKFIFTCNFLVFVILMFVVVNDLILLFLFYECMMIPSFIFVYFISPYRRGIQASLYFLIWTQLGSLLVLTAISYIVYTIGGSSFSLLRDFVFTNDEVWYLFFLIFLGFGF